MREGRKVGVNFKDGKLQRQYTHTRGGRVQKRTQGQLKVEGKPRPERMRRKFFKEETSNKLQVVQEQSFHL